MMQPTTEKPQRSIIPPWSILLIQSVWLVTLILAFHTGLALSSTWHFVFGGVLSVTLIVGLFLRWRWALFVSGLFFAGALGGTFAHRLASLGRGYGSEEEDLFFMAALVIQVFGWVIHFPKASFRWLEFESIRSARLWFLVVTFAGFCLWAVRIYYGSVQAA
jgi:hypothetical protein